MADSNAFNFGRSTDLGSNIGCFVLWSRNAGWSELQTKTEGVTLGLGEQNKPTPGNAVPVFGVPDIVTARKDLESAGVEFDGQTEVIEGMVSTATFYDPDRNALMLAQDLTNEG